MSEHDPPTHPFAHLRVERGQVRATLRHDPAVEGVEMAMYVDGSGSTNDEHEHVVRRTGGGLLWERFGWGAPPEEQVLDNEVELQVRGLLQYLATKDRHGRLRVAYWACGPVGADVETIGTLSSVSVDQYRCPGPHQPGGHALLAPAMRDFIDYFRRQASTGARRGCAVFVTAGPVHDATEVKALSARIAGEVGALKYPPVQFILVGVGDQVDEKQLDEVCRGQYEGLGRLWCHRVARDLPDLAEVVAVLVEETTTVAKGGVVTDDHGRVLKRYEGRLPAVLEFVVSDGCASFTLEVAGQRYTQPLPDETDEDDEP